MKAETIFNKIFLGFDFPRLDWFPADLGPPRSGLILTAIEIPFIFTECDIDIDNDWLLIEKKRKSMRHFMRHFMRHLVKDQLSFIFNRSSAENP